MSDLDFLHARIAAGDADAFGQWLAGAEPRVRGSLASFARALDVEAVLQEALVRLWQVAPRFVPDGKPDALIRFAIRIARNLAVSELRRTRSRPVEPADLEADLAVDVPAPDPLLRQAIVDCRDKLPPKPRQALDARLAAAGSRDDDELAASVNMKLNTFLQNFTRARQLLAACLGKRGIVVEMP
ncbi:MAG: sigma-70 family RNA polymerase sigma factor [Deltaproteobacteria bacterium]|nr:sigma-70 family RNA polymerase sigma factor [Deltaproteobacteria bacterium]